mgnify:FL=1
MTDKTIRGVSTLGMRTRCNEDTINLPQPFLTLTDTALSELSSPQAMLKFHSQAL